MIFVCVPYYLTNVYTPPLFLQMSSKNSCIQFLKYKKYTEQILQTIPNYFYNKKKNCHSLIFVYTEYEAFKHEFRPSIKWCSKFGHHNFR